MKVFLIRGLPGSGKSTLAKKLVEKIGAVHLEADMYFVDSTGKYVFDRTKLREAHDWCQDSFYHALVDKRDVIVSNTFVADWELANYFSTADAFDAQVYVVECNGTYDNVHDLPAEVMFRMKNRFIPNSAMKPRVSTQFVSQTEFEKAHGL
jgi:adenylate kinase family enzyme